ncbi:DedA family protein [Yunchengibacter salinarum]|uniref:DedA family protein n=1 Tax=Yunchengibacter salinarum TaxID=3133399 RepID=UPI0035B698EC
MTETSASSIIDFVTAIGNAPLAMAALLAVATLITEDGALIAGSLLVGNDSLPVEFAIGGLVAGISLGDVGVYMVGRLARSVRWLRRRLPLRRIRRFRRWLKGREIPILFFSRFLPGTRVPTYISFGFLRFSVWRFWITMTVAALVWVSGMVLFVSNTQRLLSKIGGVWGVIGALVLAIAIIILMPRLMRHIKSVARLPFPEKDD